LLQTPTGALFAIFAGFTEPMHVFPALVAPTLLSVNKRGGTDESKSD
jgi:hypothetical protein